MVCLNFSEQKYALGEELIKEKVESQDQDRVQDRGKYYVSMRSLKHFSKSSNLKPVKHHPDSCSVSLFMEYYQSQPIIGLMYFRLKSIGDTTIILFVSIGTI